MVEDARMSCQGSSSNYDNSSQPSGATAGAQGGADVCQGQRAVKLSWEQIFISATLLVHPECR